MGRKDPRIDAYIAKQRDFARPVLTFLRDVIHEACPDVEETLTWSSPSFMHHGLLCGFAAFKEHATFGFWKHELRLGQRSGEAMGSFGRLTTIRDLPSRRDLLGLAKRAMALNEDGVSVPRVARRARAPIPMPAAFRAARGKHKKAKAVFDAFPPSHKREYLEYITEAKRDETRERRIKQTIGCLAKGKSRNWKYQ